jgi:hypothetical protein
LQVLAQVLRSQRGMVFGAVQERPHMPQFCGDVAVSTSHPLAALPSQSPVVPVHVIDTPHVPSGRHTAVAPAGAVQVLLQRPQWVVDPVMRASHPLVALPSQLR